MMPKHAAEPDVNFSENFRLRAPRGFARALRLVAKQHHTLPSEYARQILLRAMAADGVRIQDGEARRVS